MKQLKFIHIPRTGGTTVEDCAKKEGYDFGRFDGIYCHSTNKDCIDIFEQKPPLWHRILNNSSKLIKNFTFFAIIRNPLDRFISEYYRPMIEYYTSKVQINSKLEIKFNESLDQFNNRVTNILNNVILHKDNKILSGHYAPQINYLCTERQDLLLFFDDFKNMCSNLFSNFKMNISLENQHSGKSIKKIYSYSDLSSSNQKLFNIAYERDMVLYNKLNIYYKNNTNIFTYK